MHSPQCAAPWRGRTRAHASVCAFSFLVFAGACSAPSADERAEFEPEAQLAPGDSAHGAHATHASSDPELVAQQHDPCRSPVTPDPRDATLPNQPQIIMVGRNQDVTVPQAVLDWMKETQFAEAHDGWHLVRRWDQGCRRSNAPAEGCAAAQRLLNQGLWRANVQQGAPGDGLAFMMAHRHMIEMLKQTFPKHASLFDGFKKVPRTRSDPENPMPWKNINWTSNNLRAFDVLENIERNLSQFASEDELGHFIQGSIRWTPERPSNFVNQPGSGIHGALHGQWNVAGSPAALINQAIDVRNHIFWKLHGWIDDVWERYRVAKGMKKTDRDYQQLHHEQCVEMHALEPRNRKGTAPKPGTPPPPQQDPYLDGMFGRTIKPFLDEKCAGCHSANGGAAAGLLLGGDDLTIGDLVLGLNNVPSTNGQYALVVPGDPMKSWLYLKASGDSTRVTCTSGCDRQKMPPAGDTLTAAELASLRDWIAKGATLD